SSFNFTDLEDSQIPQFIDDVIFSTNMLGYLDQEFVDGYVDLLLEKDLSKKQKRMVQNTKDIIFEQRQKLKNSKQEVSLGLSYQQPDSGEDGDNHYGKPHFIEGKYLNIEGDSFLIARHDFDSPEALYSSDGEMTNLFGSPHESIREMIEFNCQKFIIAQHETLGSFNFYSLDGEIADLFGASHNNVWDFVEIEGEMLLKAEHRQGMWALYSIDGKNKWFGRDHAFIYSDVIDSFVEFEGQKFVKDTAIQGNRPILYSIDGFYFEGEDSVKVSKYGVPKLYDKTYFTMKDWLWQEKNPLHGMSIEIIEKISDYNLLDQSINLFGSDCDNMLDSLTDIFRDSGLFDYWLSIVDKFSKDGKNKLDLSESINVAKKTYSLKERFMEVSNFNMNLKEGSTDSLTELGELVTMKMGDYQVLRVIGEGAEGIVYQAKHDILGDVKLKIFKDPEDKIKEAIEKEGVTLEERIQARMMNLDDIEDMKYITRFKGLGTCKNPRTNKKTLYLTLEYIDGGAVEIMGATDYSIREDIKLQDINSIYSKFLDGLEVIHNAGKILKDVKLRNILVSYDHKKVKIDDLETISGIDEVQQGKRITCGSDRYAAPEALTDIINATQQSDLYSSAICLLYMKTRNPTLMLGINDILEPDEYTLKLNDMLSKQNLSKSQEEFFNKALAYSPCNRYQSVSEMKSESQDLF
ncbi:MAG: protein kinase, partial [Nanoarchaeota archaeon]|nr:protein kinase [Nanoarchaeota archaeon]